MPAFKCADVASRYLATSVANDSYTQPNGGTWHNPTTILSPKLLRLNFTINY